MIEKRQYKRYSIKGVGRASDNSDQNYKFIVNNISAGGMNITTEKELKDESPLTLQLDMPQPLLLPRTKQLQGMVVWKKEESDAFTYGIRFLGLTKSETEEIEKSLRDGHFTALAQPVETPRETKK
jgi:c-di-GMP-binding flagellar brake protein YcgR